MRSLISLLLAALLTATLSAVDIETVFRDLSDPVEVVFVMDTSGSMGSAIYGVRDNIIDFASALEDSGYGYRFGATTLGDGTNSWDFDAVAPGYNMTPDVSEFQAQVAITGAAGGEDTPETQIDGLYDAATLYDWAPGTLHVMIMFTNSDFHYPGDGTGFSDVHNEDLITLLITEGFLVYTSFGPVYIGSTGFPNSDSVYQLIADTTGGCSFDLSTRSYTSSWETIFNTVRDDVMRYYSLSTHITGLSGLTLEEIELEMLPEFTSFGPRIVDLSGPEYDGVDEIDIAWTMQLTGTPTEDSPYIVTLRTASGNYYDADLLNYQVPVGVAESESETPVALSISAYPSPFNSAVTISVPRADNIEIFDQTGRFVAQMKLEDDKTTWRPSDNITSGVYLVRATVGDETNTRRIVYLK